MTYYFVDKHLQKVEPVRKTEHPRSAGSLLWQSAQWQKKYLQNRFIDSIAKQNLQAALYFIVVTTFKTEQTVLQKKIRGKKRSCRKVTGDHEVTCKKDRSKRRAVKPKNLRQQQTEYWPILLSLGRDPTLFSIITF